MPAGAGDGRRDGEWGRVKIRETTDKQKEEQKMRFEVFAKKAEVQVQVQGMRTAVIRGLRG